MAIVLALLVGFGNANPLKFGGVKPGVMKVGGNWSTGWRGTLTEAVKEAPKAALTAGVFAGVGVGVQAAVQPGAPPTERAENYGHARPPWAQYLNPAPAANNDDDLPNWTWAVIMIGGILGVAVFTCIICYFRFGRDTFANNNRGIEIG